MNLYIFNQNRRGAEYGVGTYIRELTAAVKDCGIQISVVNLASDKPQIQIEEIDGIKYLHFPIAISEQRTTDNQKQWELYFRNIVYLLRLHIRDQENLIFHLNYCESAKLAEELKNAFACKIIAVAHFSEWGFTVYDNLQRLRTILNEEQADEFAEKLQKSFDEEKQYYLQADRVICLSNYMREILCRDYGLDAGKISVIPNGLQDNEQLIINNEKLTKRVLREKWNIAPKEKIIFFAGRVDEVKGVSYLIKAFREVLDQLLNCRLIIAGSGNYNTYLQEAKNLCPKITFTGQLEKNDLYELYQIANLGVVPSLFEPFGLVAVEMMMHGLPLVATATSGLNEVVDESCGLKIPLTVLPDSVEIDTSLLAEKILYLLQNPAFAKRMGKNARKRYMEKYALTAFESNMTAFYNSLYLKRKEKITEDNIESKQIDMSVIVPVYNVENYLRICLDSLMNQGDLRIEIILVNDGSTDRSGAIADEYAQKGSHIKVIHQENGGASAARNAGLKLAQGEYIAFVDSDDWVKKDALLDMLSEAVKNQADVLTGNVWLCHQDGNLDSPFKKITSKQTNNSLSGKEGFIRLVKTRFYLPMPFKYIYRRSFLEEIQAGFEEGIMHEDELWSPIVLCQARKMVITDIEFYYYRRNDTSVMHTTKIQKRLDSLFRVTDKLMEFEEQFDFSEENGELKDWWYVNIFRLYAMAFTLLPDLKDSSYELPKHYIDRLWNDCLQKMPPNAQQRCKDYYTVVKAGLK